MPSHWSGEYYYQYPDPLRWWQKTRLWRWWWHRKNRKAWKMWEDVGYTTEPVGTEGTVFVLSDGQMLHSPLPCPRDTNGDGNCGRPLCPHCGWRNAP